MSQSRVVPLKKRAYRDGVQLSIIGMGGLVVARLDQAAADRLVARSIECGVNYFDVSPTYFDAQDRLGPALQPYRDAAFLACKTTQRTAVEARRELEDSLRALRTDHVDLYQFHGLNNVQDVQQVLAPGGAAEAFVQARKEGKVRYIGCSAHSTDAAMAMMAGFKLDSIVFPVNYACCAKGLGPSVLQEAQRRGIPCIAIKSMARCARPKTQKPPYEKIWYIPIDRPDTAALALRFTLSQNVVAAIPPGNEVLYEMALDLAMREDITRPLTPPEAEMLASCLGAASPLFMQH